MNAFDRAIKLHRLLAAQRIRAMPLDELCEALECAPATVKRVIRKLRDDFHAPLIHDAERGGYRYDGEAQFEVPGLWFTADELAALLVMDEVLAQHPQGLLATALAPLRERLAQLARKRGIQLPALRRRLRLLRMAARDTGLHFACVADALARDRRLRIDYHARSTDRMAPREVSPQRLTQYRDNWYLDAWCHARDELRTFALDRIIAAEIIDTPARRVDDTALDDVLATSYGIFAGTPSATAVLRFVPAARPWVAAERWHPQQRDRVDEHDHLIRELPYHHADELVRDLLKFGPEVEVLAPAPLRRAVQRRLRDALAGYERRATEPAQGRPRIRRIRN